jgi:hypothetical protein
VTSTAFGASRLILLWLLFFGFGQKFELFNASIWFTEFDGFLGIFRVFLCLSTTNSCLRVFGQLFKTGFGVSKLFLRRFGGVYVLSYSVLDTWLFRASSGKI